MKAKTHKVAAKRIKVTAGGKLIRRHQGSRHLRLKKNRRRIRRFHEPVQINSGFKRSVKRLLKR